MRMGRKSTREAGKENKFFKVQKQQQQLLPERLHLFFNA